MFVESKGGDARLQTAVAEHHQYTVIPQFLRVPPPADGTYLLQPYLGVPGCRKDKATIEHLNRLPPFKWPRRRRHS